MVSSVFRRVLQTIRHAWLVPALSLAAISPLVHCSSAENGMPKPDAATRDARKPRVSYCESGKATVSYPDASAPLPALETLPNLTFKSETGNTITASSFFEPCAASPTLLVFRVTATFCGSCRWSAKHTAEIEQLGNVKVIDVLVRDEWNLPPTPASATAYRALSGKSASTLVLDGEHQFAKIASFKQELPLFVFVDARTMRIQSYQANPTGDGIAERIRIELAELAGTPSPPAAETVLIDGLFTQSEWDMVKEMALPAQPPIDPTNAYAGSEPAAVFGKKLFVDASLSTPGNVSCATCHNPALAFQDNTVTSTGAIRGDRNSPSTLFAAYNTFQFWDGRADTLWMQALGPMENPKEFASSRLFIARRIASAYAAEYAAVFPSYPLPDFSDEARFPRAGKPGDAAYDAMYKADQDAVTRIFVNVAKAIAAFEGKIQAQETALDQYIAGNKEALTLESKEGLKHWFIAGCIQCHWGPALTDGAFHNVRFASGRADGKGDEGAELGIPKLIASDFRASGRWSDDPSKALQLERFTPEAIASLRGAFKTPSVRGTADGNPWGHGGSVNSLLGVAQQYGKAGLPENDPRALGPSEPWVTEFDIHTQVHVSKFMEALSAKPVPR
jgi:cytochrome c peroxidase